jgi:IS605 OrfB family transposase
MDTMVITRSNDWPSRITSYRTTVEILNPIRSTLLQSLPTEDELLCDDGVPMETQRHKYQMDLLIDTLSPWLDQREDGYVRGNMFMYFSTAQVKNQDFKGLDVFVVLGVPKRERKCWVVWEEEKAPDVVIELLSDSTAHQDKGEKKPIYQDKLRVPEYFWYGSFDPDDWARFFLNDGHYESLPSGDRGQKVSNSKHFKKHYRRLKKAQKSLSRKQKDSKNREKVKIKVAKVHAQITDSRKDYLHKLTTQLMPENQTIVVENLAVKNMVRNAPPLSSWILNLGGSGVKKNKLAQAISDVSLGEITRQLAYKCRWYGRNYIEIERWFPSSKRCSSCGHIVKKMPLNIREWDCSNCGTHHDRDINASRNILAAGLAVSVRVTTVRPEQSKSVQAGAKPRKGKKQKPKL